MTGKKKSADQKEATQSVICSTRIHGGGGWLQGQGRARVQEGI